jgi:hypothetical protein
MAEGGQLEADALKRKERLQALKRKRDEQSGNAETENGDSDVKVEDAPLPKWVNPLPYCLKFTKWNQKYIAKCGHLLEKNTMLSGSFFNAGVYGHVL